MRRSRKPRVVWLPPTNANSVDTVALISGIQTFQLDVSTDAVGDAVTGEIPLTIDGTDVDPLAASSSLSDVENSGYRLRRIVGKVFAFALQRPDGVNNNAFAAAVTAGIMVRRIDPGSDLSLGFLAGSTPSDELINPQYIRNFGDPWIWRRTWVLGNNQAAQRQGAGFFGNFPESNTEYGSAVDGPHIDQKTARIIGPEERLFLDVSAEILTSGSNSTFSVRVWSDIRLLASMRTSSGNRRNASR